MNDLKLLLTVAVILTVACSFPTKNENNEKPEETAHPVSLVQTEPSMGEKIYNQFCMVCHMKDGSGVPVLNPPLIKSEWVNGDKDQLIKIVLNGSEGGKYPVNGETYTNAMTPHNFLSDEKIAAVLTFVRSNFENNSDEVTPAEVAAARESNGK
ncbi:cytochrome c [Fulvivirgaceae bacterium BMA12]|uniref:Cytochrome c n=1 Tax=Agaribacillus aureus TaxID=3051825 RepID=A0ABT8LGC0_9BACT|nr:cytochrome c [Fulvivirgaceae bacterium BMA12]